MLIATLSILSGRSRSKFNVSYLLLKMNMPWRRKQKKDPFPVCRGPHESDTNGDSCFLIFERKRISSRWFNVLVQL